MLDGSPVAIKPRSEFQRLSRQAAKDEYQLVGEIGRGPQSIVYHALYGSLKQPVALKVFRAGVCSRDDWDARIRRGAELWASLTHPQIVLVNRSGWWDDRPYVAMDFVPQGSLAARIPEQKYSLRQALRLVEQLAEIVGYLHRQGVVHGNLKPSNVLLAADGIPRIVDLRLTGGLFLGASSTDADVRGFAYPAPEQIENLSGDPHPHTDVYGLGAILYELLTGRPPFAGESQSDILQKVQHQDPTPPSQFNPEVTPQVESLCLRCLRKNPWARFYRTYDLMTRLRSLQENPSDPNPGKRRGMGRE